MKGIGSGMGKRVLGLIRKLPRPEYTEHLHWDRVYERHLAATAPIEWGLPPHELVNYRHSLSASMFSSPKDEVAGSLEEHVGMKDRVLVAGCGNSLLSEYMFLCGWKNITSVDFSPIGVKQVQERAEKSGLGAMKFEVADMRRLHETFAANSFDSVVDKGTLDAMYCSAASDTSLPAMKEAILRVLAGGGRYVCVVNGGIYGILHPPDIAELMHDPRWDTLERRRLMPLSDGLQLYIWTKKKKT